MPVLRFAHNYRQIHLSDDESADFGVRLLKRNGETPYYPWRGFIERKVAQRIPGAKPVKLDVASYKLSDEWIAGEWISLETDQAIQGCLVNGVVFAVMEKGVPKVVPKGLHFGTG